MSILFSIICNVITVSVKAVVTEAIADADIAAECAIRFSIMSTDQKVVDFWSKFYRIMYRVFAIINMILFGIMLIKAIFGVNVLLWAQWSFENLCTRIYEHVKIQMSRPLLEQMDNEKLNKRLEELTEAYLDENMSIFKASGEDEFSEVLEDGTRVTIKRISEDEIRSTFEWSDEAIEEIKRPTVIM